LENRQPVILQGHMDMVCAVAEGSGYEPETSPITMVVDGDVLRSDGRSSLGADNGLSVSMAAWLMTTDAVHGPVRLILTTREETGMHGARYVDPAWLADCRFLLNLDAAHFGTAIIGCAGGRRDCFTKAVTTAAPVKKHAFRVTVSGLRGGHSSGYDALFRGNAIKLLSGFLTGLKNTLPFELADFHGGNAQNAIPTDASAVVVTDDAAALTAATDAFRAELCRFYRQIDPDVTFTAEEIPVPAQVWTADLTEAVLNLTGLVFHGIRAMHPTIHKLPSASCNLGLLSADDRQVQAVTFTRCAAAFMEQQIGLQHTQTAALCGFAVETDAHAGWDGDPDSELVRLASHVFREQFGQELEVCAVHAGLEPGVLGEKNPELTMISMGPNLHDLHAVTERADLPSVIQFTRYLAALLEALANS
jgi:dipeptidase D